MTINIPPTGFASAQNALTERGRGPLTPADFEESLLLVANDVDGTLFPSYQTMLIVPAARRDIPGVFLDAISQHYGRESDSYTRARDYFIGCDRTACKVDDLFREVGHKNVLHQPLRALEQVVAKIIADFKDAGIIKSVIGETKELQGDGSGGVETQINNATQWLIRYDYRMYHAIGHCAFDGVSKWLDRCSEQGVPNPLFTNTEAKYVALKMLDTYGHGAGQIDLAKTGIIVAKADDSLANGVAWDGSEGSFKALIGWMDKNGHRFDEAQTKKLASIHAMMRVVHGNKPNPTGMKMIIEHYRAPIEARVNAVLKEAGWQGEPFKLTARNVAMVGESASDAGCTFDHQPQPGEKTGSPAYYRDLLNSDVPRLARFFWQKQGARQSEDIIEADRAIRGSQHLFGMREYVQGFGMQRVPDSTMEGLSEEVLEVGYKTLNQLVKRNVLRLGMNITREKIYALPNRDLQVASEGPIDPSKYFANPAWIEAVRSRLPMMQRMAEPQLVAQ